jgi:hypothetical protein
MATIDLDRPESSIQQSTRVCRPSGCVEQYGEIWGVALKDRFRNLGKQVSNQANAGYRKIRVEIRAFRPASARGFAAMLHGR